MSAIDKRMENWESDWELMEQPEKDLFFAVEKELATLRAVVEVARDALVAYPQAGKKLSDAMLVLYDALAAYDKK